ncbi:MAG: hypothetical protein QXK94_03215 [Candidatus Jordarchaeales archaeon]
MVKKGEVERLKERAMEVLEVAEKALEAGKHGIAVFWQISPCSST